jgi:hypothetical protein
MEILLMIEFQFLKEHQDIVDWLNFKNTKLIKSLPTWSNTPVKIEESKKSLAQFLTAEGEKR